MNDIRKDIELSRLRSSIEDDTVTMISLIISEADKKKLPIELHHDNMLTFLKNYDQMQDREKRLIAEGYPEKHTTQGSKVYSRLIKILTAR